MFNTHQNEIGHFARESAGNMARVYQFVITTVQQSLVDTPNFMSDIDTQGDKSKHLWGWKRDAFTFSIENADAIFDTSMTIYREISDPEIVRHELLKFFAGLPGLGLVKGGFMVQLCFGLSGCIDTHNINRFGLDDKTFKAARFKGAKTDKTRNAIVRAYHEIVDACGGCAALWDEWCEHVASRQPQNYDNAFDVSAIHVLAIKGKA